MYNVHIYIVDGMHGHCTFIKHIFKGPCPFSYKESYTFKLPEDYMLADNTIFMYYNGCDHFMWIKK